MVGIKTGIYWYEIGNGGFLFSFFSTIAYRLENGYWGSIYPTIMNGLYRSPLPNSSLKEALIEVNKIQEHLGNFSTSQVVWDFDNLETLPPWGGNISPHISSLRNYFVTCNGEDLIDLLKEVIEKGIEENTSVSILEL